MQVSQIIEADEKTFGKEVFGGKVSKVVAVFYADWCPYSKKLLAILPEIARKYGGLVKVVRVKVEDGTGKIVNAEAYKKARIRAYPTIVTFVGGIYIDIARLQHKDFGVNLLQEVEKLILKILG